MLLMHENLSEFSPLSSHLKGSTVNMNIMGWVYSEVSNYVSTGYTTLGISLMIGKYQTLASVQIKDSGYMCKKY